MAQQVFISHSAKDKTIADAVTHHLEAAGARCWIAPRDIPPGENWAGSIIRALDQSAAMVLIFSEFANASAQIIREVENAVRREIPIIPLRVTEVRPSPDLEYFLSSTHWLDALTPDRETAIQRLTERVLGLFAGITPPPTGHIALDRETLEHWTSAQAGLSLLEGIGDELQTSIDHAETRREADLLVQAQLAHAREFGEAQSATFQRQLADARALLDNGEVLAAAETLDSLTRQAHDLATSSTRRTAEIFEAETMRIAAEYSVESDEAVAQGREALFKGDQALNAGDALLALERYQTARDTFATAALEIPRDRACAVLEEGQGLFRALATRMDGAGRGQLEQYYEGARLLERAERLIALEDFETAYHDVVRSVDCLNQATSFADRRENAELARQQTAETLAAVDQLSLSACSDQESATIREARQRLATAESLTENEQYDTVTTQLDEVRNELQHVYAQLSRRLAYCAKKRAKSTAQETSELLSAIGLPPEWGKPVERLDQGREALAQEAFLDAIDAFTAAVESLEDLAGQVRELIAAREAAANLDGTIDALLGSIVDEPQRRTLPPRPMAYATTPRIAKPADLRSAAERLRAFEASGRDWIENAKIVLRSWHEGAAVAHGEAREAQRRACAWFTTREFELPTALEQASSLMRKSEAALDKQAFSRARSGFDRATEVFRSALADCENQESAWIEARVMRDRAAHRRRRLEEWCKDNQVVHFDSLIDGADWMERGTQALRDSDTKTALQCFTDAQATLKRGWKTRYGALDGNDYAPDESTGRTTHAAPAMGGTPARNTCDGPEAGRDSNRLASPGRVPLPWRAASTEASPEGWATRAVDPRTKLVFVLKSVPASPEASASTRPLYVSASLVSQKQFEPRPSKYGYVRTPSEILPASVSWRAAQRYCEHHGYRLLTDHEWQFITAASPPNGDEASQEPDTKRSPARESGIRPHRRRDENLGEWCADSSRTASGAKQSLWWWRSKGPKGFRCAFDPEQ